MGQPEAGDHGSEGPEQTVLLDEKKAATILRTKTTADDPPVDRNNYVYMIFLLHGVGVLMAWNMFITAKSYFVDYKLSLNATLTSGHAVTNGSFDHNDTWTEDEEQLHQDVTEYRSNFLSYVGLAAQIPNVLCNALNLFIRSRSVFLCVKSRGSRVNRQWVLISFVAVDFAPRMVIIVFPVCLSPRYLPLELWNTGVGT